MNELQAQLPTAEEAALAKLCSQELSATLEMKAGSQRVTVTDSQGRVHAVQMPVSALRLLVEVLTELGQGNTVRLVPVHAELTTQEAADMLNISRPTLIKLLDEGHIGFHRIGNRRKLRFLDVLQYKQTLEDNRLQTLDELADLDQELGLGY